MRPAGATVRQTKRWGELGVAGDWWYAGFSVLVGNGFLFFLYVLVVFLKKVGS